MLVKVSTNEFLKRDYSIGVFIDLSVQLLN